MKKARTTYSLEFKVSAAKMSIHCGSIANVAEELKISRHTLEHWRKSFKEGKLTLKQSAASDAVKNEISRLRNQIKELKIARYSKKGAKHLLQERRVRYEFIKEHSNVFPVEKMFQIFQVHHSSFYRWRKGLPTSRATRKVFITSEIIRIYQWSECRYGSPRIAKELAILGIQASRGFVGKIMKQQNIRSISKLKFKKTTNSSHTCLIAENKLNQDFKVNNRNEVWVSDITYIETDKGWIYLTVVIDLFDRKVIGWSLSDTLKAIDTSITAFNKAILHVSLENTRELIFHSDRGKQYACREFTALLDTNKITQSMSRKGNCYDNAVAESFFKTLKSELAYQNKYKTKEKAEKSIADYLENFYNTCRRHSAFGNLTIEEFHNQQSIKQ